ncbi:MAG TPA: hypothetical protein VKE98_05520 [Gemmataceae bacterium]|nr:hypothetical protein [Gemmataceae bacterium]
MGRWRQETSHAQGTSRRGPERRLQRGRQVHRYRVQGRGRDPVGSCQRQELQTFNFTQSILHVALSADGGHLVTGQRATAILWDTAGGKKLQTFAKNTSAQTSLAVSSSGRHVVTGSPSYPNYSDTPAVLWDVAGGKKPEIQLPPVWSGPAVSRGRVYTGGVPVHLRRIQP